MQKNTEAQISDQKILLENKEMPIAKNILEMMDQETLKGTDQTEKHSQQIVSKKLADQNDQPLDILKSEVNQRKKSSSEPTQENPPQLGGTLAVELSQKSNEKMGKKKGANKTKNRQSKQKKSKKEEAAPVKKTGKDIAEKSEAVMKPKKTANSIKKNKEPVPVKVITIPPASTMPNIMTMLSQLPLKKKEPVKISQIKCEAPRIDTVVKETKEWHIAPLKESEKPEDTQDKDIKEDTNKKVEGQCWEIAPSNLIQKQQSGFQNMAPLLQTDPKSEQTHIPQSDKPGQKKDSPSKDLGTNIPPQSEKVTQWKNNRAAYINELRDLLDDSNSKFYNQFNTNIIQKEEFTKFVKGAKFPDEILQNKKVQTESEQKQIIDEIKRFGDLTSSKDQSSFQINDQTRVPIFKIFAHLVDSSKLELNDLAILCENYLIAQLKQILTTDPNCTVPGIKVKTMITKSAFKITDLITLLAERKIIDLKNFSAKLIDQFDDKNTEEQKHDDMLLSRDALYSLPFWEISGEASLYLSQERLRVLQSEKPLRRRVIDRARFLDRIIGMIDKLKKEKEITKIEEEVERYQNLLDSHKVAIQKEQQRQLEKEKKEKLELERQKMKENERLFKEAEKKRKEEERLEQKRQKEEQLEKEKKDRFEKQLQLDRERKLKQEQLEKEKKEKQEKLEKEKLEKAERLEKEKKDRLEKIEREKKERQERIEREKKERAERIEREKQEKERIQKEEAERKAKEEAEVREKQSLFKYLNKNKDKEKEHSKSASQQQEEQKNAEQLSIQSGSQPQQNEIESKFKDYGECTCIAIKIQKECYLVKEKMKLKSFEHIPSDNVNCNNVDELAEFEKKNKLSICQHFKKINENLDKYLYQPERYKICYPKETDIKYPPNSTTSVIINTTPIGKFGPINKILRKKSIIIDEQLKTSFSVAKEFKRSKILTCRNPFKMDNGILNYEMDTEDEEAEENGEDVEMEERSKDEDDHNEDESVQAGWLVDDDYLSMSEMNLSNISNKDENQIQDELEHRKAILKKNRESKENQRKEYENFEGHLKPQIFIYGYQNREMMNEYGCINFVSDCFMGKANTNFPIDLTKTKIKKSYGEGDNEDIKKGYDPNAINLKLPQLIRMVHGSIESKPKLIDDFNDQHPECSKNSIEKKIKENFIKDKRADEPRMRYFVTEEILLQLGTEFPQGLENPELADLAQKRIQPIIDEIKQQQQEIEEKRQKELQEKDRERQELALMRYEEQQQRDYIKQILKLAEKKQRDEAKAQALQLQEEEKQRQRDLKQKQRQEEKEKKLKQIEEEKQQKAEERRVKKEEKEKEKLQKEKDKEKEKKSEQRQQNENIVQMLQKRAASTIIDQIDEFEKQQAGLESLSPLKKQKQEEPTSSAKKGGHSKQSECQKEQQKGGLMNFFQKLPPGQLATPMKLDFNIAPRETKVNEQTQSKSKTKVQNKTHDQKENINNININSGKKSVQANVEKKEKVKCKKRDKSEEKKKSEAKPNRSNSNQKNEPKHFKSKANNVAKKKGKNNENVDQNKKTDPVKPPEKKFKSVQKCLKNSKYIQNPKTKRRSQSKQKKNTEILGDGAEDTKALISKTTEEK